MASLSTCHLGLWLGWQILLNLVKSIARYSYTTTSQVAQRCMTEKAATASLYDPMHYPVKFWGNGNDNFTPPKSCTTASFTKRSVEFYVDHVTIVETRIALLTIICTIVLSYAIYVKCLHRFRCNIPTPWGNFLIF